MDMGQRKGVKAKGKKGEVEAEGGAQTDDSYFIGECGYFGKFGKQEGLVQEAEGPMRQTSAETVCQIQSDEDDPFWVFAVVDSGALRPTKDGMRRDTRLTLIVRELSA